MIKLIEDQDKLQQNIVIYFEGLQPERGLQSKSGFQKFENYDCTIIKRVIEYCDKTQKH